MPKKPAPAALTVLEPAPTPSALQYYAEQAITKALDAFEGDLGGRGPLLATLLTAPDSQEQAALVGVLADPRSDTQKLAPLLRAAGVTFGQLLDQLKKAGFAKAYIRTIGVIAERAPAVVEDVLLRAAPHYLPCRACRGAGSVPALDTTGKILLDQPHVPCDPCQGIGQIYTFPEIERQKMALDLARLLPRKAAVEVNLDQRKTMGSGTVLAMTDLIRATDDLLKTAAPRRGAPGAPGAAAVGEVIDVDVVPDPALPAPPDAGPCVTVGGQPLRQVAKGTMLSSSPHDVGDPADPDQD